jgi:hypothetical protein
MKFSCYRLKAVTTFSFSFSILHNQMDHLPFPSRHAWLLYLRPSNPSITSNMSTSPAATTKLSVVDAFADTLASYSFSPLTCGYPLPSSRDKFLTPSTPQPNTISKPPPPLITTYQPGFHILKCTLRESSCQIPNLQSALLSPLKSLLLLSQPIKHHGQN